MSTEILREVSPCKQYTLTASKHRSNVKGVYLRLCVEHPTSETEIVLEGSSMTHAWNPEKPYLILGCSSGEIVSLNLNTSEIRRSISSFLWEKVSFNSKGDFFVVQGSFWGCPSEVGLYEFHNPEHIPWPERDRFEGEFDSWLSPTTYLSFEVQERVCLEGHRLHGRLEEKLSSRTIEFLEREASRKGLALDDVFSPVYVQTPHTIPSVRESIKKWIFYHTKDRSSFSEEEKAMWRVFRKALSVDARRSMKTDPSLVVAWEELDRLFYLPNPQNPAHRSDLKGERKDPQNPLVL